MFKVREKLGFRMYDVDGNGTIEPEEMSRIVHSIYAMMGPDQVKGNVTWSRLKILVPLKNPTNLLTRLS